MYPSPSTAAPVLTFITTLNLSATISPIPTMRVLMDSLHQPKVATMKSYTPPIIPAKISGLAWLPPFSPDTSTWVVAVASGKGYLPCISDTKYLRKGMSNRIPNTPPNNELINTSKKFTLISGYLSCRIYKAGKVKMAPATTTPLLAPIDWIITFSPSAFLRLKAPDNPTAIMAMGMAASNTWPTFNPR